MATLVCYQSGNLTASIWRTCSATGEVDSIAQVQTVGTSYTSSPNFSPGAVTATGVLLFVNERMGTTGTMDVSLYNATDSLEVAAVQVNVSDLRSAGWHYFVFSSPVTLAAGKNYNVRVRTSAANQVSLYRSGTSNDWSKALVLDSTASPASNDKLHIPRMLDGTSVTTPTVVMDNTNASLVLGPSVSGNWPQSPPFAITIAGGCELAYGTAANTNYILKLNGNILVGTEGVFRLGSSANPIPASSTAILEFQVSTANQNGLFNWAGTVTMQGADPGIARTPNLTADAAAGQPVVTLSSVAGWQTGDPVALSPSRPTVSDWQEFTVSSISGNDVTLSASLTVARDGGSIPIIGGAVALNLRDHNVVVRSQSSSSQWIWNNRWRWQSGSRANYVFDLRYVTFLYLGTTAANTNGSGIGLQDAWDTGMKRIRDCLFRQCLVVMGIRYYGSTVTFSGLEIDGIIAYRCGTSTSGLIGVDLWNGAPPGAQMTFRNITFARNAHNDSARTMDLASFVGTIENVRLIGSNHRLLSLKGASDLDVFAADLTIDGLRRFFCTGSPGNDLSKWGVRYRRQRLVIDGYAAVRCNSYHGLEVAESRGLLVIRQPQVYGDGCFLGLAAAADIPIADIRIMGGRVAGESSAYPVTNVLRSFNWSNVPNIDFIDVDLKSGNGVQNLVASDSSAQSIIGDIHFENCQLPSGLLPLTSASSYTILTPREPTYGLRQPRLTISRYDQQADDWRWYTFFRGGGALDFSIYKSSAPSERLYPRRSTGGAYPRLRSTSKMCTVASGQIATVSVWVRKSASGDGEAYDGGQPALVIRRNSALGSSYRDDVVLATMTAAAGTWEKLEAVLPSAAWDTVIEIWVEVDGTAGWVNVDDWDVAVA